MKKNLLITHIYGLFFIWCLYGNNVVIPIVSQDHYYELLNTNKPIVIQYAAAHCNYCKTITPLYELIAQDQEFCNNTIFATIDVAQDRYLCDMHDVIGVPTFCYVYKGTLLKKITGLKNDYHVQDWVQEFRQSLRSTFRVAYNKNYSVIELLQDWIYELKNQDSTEIGFFQKIWNEIVYFCSSIMNSIIAFLQRIPYTNYRL